MKKGTVLDIIFGLAVVFFAALFVVVFYVMSADTEISSALDLSSFNVFATFFGNYLIPLMFIMFVLSAGTLAYYTPSHPILLFFMIFLLIIGIYFAPMLTNGWVAFSSDNKTASTVSASFPQLNTFMTRLPIFMFGGGILVLFVLASKLSRGGETA